MDDVASLHYDETPKAKYLRYIIWSLVGGFVTTVSIIALVRGFSDDGQQGHAFLGIAVFLFTLITFYLQFKTITGDLSDAARIPVYVLLALCVFLGVSILIVVYSDWHPAELDCYYNNPSTYVRQQGSPQCWDPPTRCFRSSTGCMFYLPPNYQTANDFVCGDHFSGPVNGKHNRTWTCSYTQLLPTPAPTPPPVQPSAPPPSSLQPKKAKVALKTYNAEESEAENINADAKENQDLLGYLNEYYAKYVQGDEEK